MILVLTLILGLFYLIFNQVLTVHVAPVIGGLVNTSTMNTTAQATWITKKNMFMDFFHSLPYVILFGLLFYGIVISILNKREV